MRRFYKIEVDCANCAAKIERKAKKLEGVNDLSINFMTQKMMLDANDDIFEQKLEEIIKLGKKLVSDFEVYK